MPSKEQVNFIEPKKRGTVFHPNIPYDEIWQQIDAVFEKRLSMDEASLQEAKFRTWRDYHVPFGQLGLEIYIIQPVVSRVLFYIDTDTRPGFHTLQNEIYYNGLIELSDADSNIFDTDFIQVSRNLQRYLTGEGITVSYALNEITHYSPRLMVFNHRMRNVFTLQFIREKIPGENDNGFLSLEGPLERGNLSTLKASFFETLPTVVGAAEYLTDAIMTVHGAIPVDRSYVMNVINPTLNT
jgi:hypothetical protein